MAYRLNQENDTEAEWQRVRMLVRNRAELFSTVVDIRWLADWKAWVMHHQRWPRWVHDDKHNSDDREEIWDHRAKLVAKLKEGDVFRCQLRSWDQQRDPRKPPVDDNWEKWNKWAKENKVKSTGKTDPKASDGCGTAGEETTPPPPGDKPCCLDKVQLGLEHIDRLYQSVLGHHEDRARRWTIGISAVVPVLVALASCAIAWQALQTNKQMSEVARESSELIAEEARKTTRETSGIQAWDGLIKEWDLARQIRAEAYENIFTAMQAAFAAAEQHNNSKINNQLALVRSNLNRLEPLLLESEVEPSGEQNKQKIDKIWTDYRELRCLCTTLASRIRGRGSPPSTGVDNPECQGVTDQMPRQPYNLTRIHGAPSQETATQEEQNRFQQLDNEIHDSLVYLLFRDNPNEQNIRTEFQTVVSDLLHRLNEANEGRNQTR